MPILVILESATAIERGSTTDAVNRGGGRVVLVLPPGVWVSSTVEKVFPPLVRFANGTWMTV